jgi:hypothetical protein
MLNDLSIRELTEKYNELAEQLGEKTVADARDKATALARLKAITARAKKTKPKAKREPAVLAPLPFLGNRKKVYTKTGKSLRGLFYTALVAGATEEELLAVATAHCKSREIPVPNNIVRIVVRNLHRHTGCGTRQSSDGKFHLVTE